MSFLGTLFQLPEQSRLTDVTILPREGLPPRESATAFVQWMVLPKCLEPDVHAGALAAFVDDVIATTSGTTPEGDGWIALFLLARDDGDTHVLVTDVAEFIPEGRTALAPVRRALRLTGIEATNIQTRAFQAGALAAAFRAGGGQVVPCDRDAYVWDPIDVDPADISWEPQFLGGSREAVRSGWSIEHMVLGLIVELTGTSLTDVVSNADQRDAAPDPVGDSRTERLSSMLYAWAEKYEGPEI